VATVRGKRLGEYLLEKGWITSEQLQRALTTHRTIGGRLGTCLLEMDALPEDLLLKALGEINNATPVSVDELRQAREEAYQLVSGRVAKRCQAIPFRLSGNQIWIALLDFHNLHIQDELGFVTGKRVKVFVANEARIFEALERFYGEECPTRYVNLLDRLNRTRYLWERTVTTSLEEASKASLSGAHPLTAPASILLPSPPLLAPPEPREAAVQAAPDPTPVETASASKIPARTTTPSVPAAPPAAASPPLAKAAIPPAEPAPVAARTPSRSVPVAPDELEKLRGVPDTLSLEQVEAMLLNPRDRDDVARALLGFLGPLFRRVALLRIIRDELSGWMGCGDLDVQALQRFSGKFSEPSMFVGLKQSVPFARGPLAPFPLHRRLAEAWNGELPGDCLLLPVRIKDRLVTVLYMDCGKEGLGALDLGPFLRLAAKAAIAFEMCIMRGKLKKA
jgi:Type II secretion system (T2SS), protein E, N-terminal domain